MIRQKLLQDNPECDEYPNPIETSVSDQNALILDNSDEYFMHCFLVLLVRKCSLMKVLFKRLESLRLFEDAGSQLEVPAVSSLVQLTSPDKTNHNGCQTLAEEQKSSNSLAVSWS